MVTEKKIRVLVVDDHAIVRQGLVRLFTAEPDIEVVGEASGGHAAVASARQLLPDVVVMDVRMRDGDGIEAARTMHAEFPEVRVIGLSMFDEVEQTEMMREAGAAAYISKIAPSETLISAIRACRPGSSAS